MNIAGENEEIDEILYTLCRHNVSIMGGWYPFPATAIAKTLDMSVHKVRYHLRKLKQQGIVDSIREGGMTEYGEVFCYHGWHITEKHTIQTNTKKHTKRKEKCVGSVLALTLAKLIKHERCENWERNRKMNIDEAIKKHKTMATKGNVIFSQNPDFEKRSDEEHGQIAECLNS